MAVEGEESSAHIQTRSRHEGTERQLHVVGVNFGRHEIGWRALRLELCNRTARWLEQLSLIFSICTRRTLLAPLQLSQTMYRHGGRLIRYRAPLGQTRKASTATRLKVCTMDTLQLPEL